MHLYLVLSKDDYRKYDGGIFDASEYGYDAEYVLAETKRQALIKAVRHFRAQPTSYITDGCGDCSKHPPYKHYVADQIDLTLDQYMKAIGKENILT